MKKLLCFILTIILIFSLSGCSHIKDTNGAEDFSLVTITDDDIIGGEYGSTSFMSSRTQLLNSVSQSAKKFSGVYTIYEQEIAAPSITVTLSATVKEGNAKIVLIYEDKIVHTFDLNEADQIYEMKNISGKIFLRIAGESANYSVKVIVE